MIALALDVIADYAKHGASGKAHLKAWPAHSLDQFVSQRH